MLKRDLVKPVGGILLGAVAMLVVLSACGGSAGAPAPVPTPSLTTAIAEQTVAPASTSPASALQPATVPTPSLTTAIAEQTVAPASTSPAGALQPTISQTPTQPVGSSQSDPLTLGKLVYETTAGGVGCAYCHGLDGKGVGTSGALAPDIRGMSEAEIKQALTGVPLMSFIKLSEEEISAVAAYLQYLGEQP